jgi:hypothetical protein
VCMCVYACVCTMLVPSAGWGMSGSGHTYTIFICFVMYMSLVIAALVQQHFFGQSQHFVHFLIGNGGAAESKDSGAACCKECLQNSSLQKEP